MKRTPWIFVTGAPRSGTTFVGRILSMSLTVDYIHEPFNPDCGIPGVDQRFAYVDPEAVDPVWVERVSDLMRYRTRLRTGYYPEDTPARRVIKAIVGSRGPFHYRLARLNPVGRHVVLKDPIGCLLTEFLARRFSMRPVVMIRHPAAFASSYKRLGWAPQLHALREQPALVSRYFAESHLLQETGNRVADAARLWTALHTVLADQLERNPDWVVLRHEDLNASPVETFAGLYARLELPWSARTARGVGALTGTSNRAEARKARVQDFRRDSKSLFDLRMAGLTPDERATVADIVAPLAARWYPEFAEAQLTVGVPSHGEAHPAQGIHA
ncbi:MAG: sulfotransferase [Gemmatimonadota bacterium]|nr:sulfotransferase [Gemmatimonadota bacterium]